MKNWFFLSFVLCSVLVASGSDDEGSPTRWGSSSFGLFSGMSGGGYELPHVGGPPKNSSFASSVRSSKSCDGAAHDLLNRQGVRDVLSNPFAIRVLIRSDIVALLLDPDVVALLSSPESLKAIKEAAAKKEDNMYDME